MAEAEREMKTEEATQKDLLYKYQMEHMKIIKKRKKKNKNEPVIAAQTNNESDTITIAKKKKKRKRRKRPRKQLYTETEDNLTEIDNADTSTFECNWNE